jgi:hypothetical protein
MSGARELSSEMTVEHDATHACTSLSSQSMESI